MYFVWSIQSLPFQLCVIVLLLYLTRNCSDQSPVGSQPSQGQVLCKQFHSISQDSPHHDWNTGGCPQHVPHLTLHDPLLCWRIDLCFYTLAVPGHELQLAVQLAKIRGMVWWSAKESSAAASLCGGTKTEEGLVAEELGWKILGFLLCNIGHCCIAADLGMEVIGLSPPYCTVLGKL